MALSNQDRLISGAFYRHRRALFWSAVVSAIIHLILLTLLFYAVARVLIPRGEREVVSQTTIATIEKRQPVEKRQSVRKRQRVQAPQPRPIVQRRRQESAPAKTPHYELAREVATPASPEPPRHQTVASNIARDSAGYAKEVARLNGQDDPHVLPTIDPSARASSTKSYQFAIPSSLRGEDHGNGIITPVRSWRDAGMNCYYGRYEFTYPDGAMEDGDIAWPFCFDPSSDPFRQPPHPIPFPLPLPGFKLSADAQLPPIEKSVYQQWAGTNARSNSTP